LAVGLYDWVLAYDHVAGRAWLISTGLPERDPARRQRRARQRLLEVKQRLRHPPSAAAPLRAPTVPASALCRQWPVPGFPGLTSNFDRAGYLATVRRAVEYVHAGDCFQVNVSQRLLYPATLPPLELYGRLRQRNPAPFAGYLDLGDFVVASA